MLSCFTLMKFFTTTLALCMKTVLASWTDHSDDNDFSVHLENEIFQEGLNKGHCRIANIGGKVSVNIARMDDPSIPVLYTVQDGKRNSGLWETIITFMFNATRKDNFIEEYGYRCFATYGSLTKVDSMHVTIYVVPSDPTISTSNVVTAGVNHTFKCHVSHGLPATYLLWRLDDETHHGLNVYHQAADKTYNTTNILYILLGPEDHGKSLRCLSHPVTLNGFVYASQILDVRYAPIVTVASTSYSIWRHELSVTINCEVKANPKSTVVWFWHDSYLSLNVTDKHALASMTLNDIWQTDSGIYLCIAANTEGTTHSPPITLQVKYLDPPIVLPRTIVANEGAEVNLSCLFAGDPPVTKITWVASKLLDSILEVTEPFLKSPSYLTLSSLNDSFTDEYQCRVSNGEMTRSSVPSKLVVHYSPKITVASTFYSVSVFEPVTLHCEIRSEPHSEVKWLKDGGEFNVATNRTVNGDSPGTMSLTIKSLQPLDSGMYRCSATNSLGTANSPDIQLRVTYRPNVSVSAESVTLVEGGVMKLMCIVDAVPPMTHLTWKVKRDDNVTTLTMTGRFRGGSLESPSILQISPVERTDRGDEYVCEAENDEGIGQSKPHLLLLSYPPKVTVLKTSYHVPITKPVTLHCKVSSYPDSEIVWTHDGRLLDWNNSHFANGSTAWSPSLTITHFNPEHSGVYVCTANNTLGTARSPNIMLDAQYMNDVPHALSSVNPIAVQPGQTITLKCETDANPDRITYIWTQGNKTFASSDMTLNVTMENVTSQHYACLATNEKGTSDPIVFNLFIKTVSYQTKIITGESDTLLWIMAIVILVVICGCASGYYYYKKVFKERIQKTAQLAEKRGGLTNSNSNPPFPRVIMDTDNFPEVTKYRVHLFKHR